jgi:hypothetical protein
MAKAIPKVTTKNIADRRLLEAIKEAIEVGEGVSGNPLDRKLTVRDLVDSGMATLTVNNTASYVKPSSINPNYPDPVVVNEDGSVIDLTPPGEPESFVAFKGVGSVFLTWGKPDFSNYAHTNIYRATTDNFSNAVIISNVLGTTYADYVPVEILDEETGDIRGYYYWLTFTTTAGVEGAPNATSGTYQEPTKNGDDAIFQLSVNLLVGDTANFVTANINDASISSAKIAQIIQSDNYDADNGWMINKNGLMVINNIYARGVIEGSRIIGSVIDGGIFIGGTDFTIPTEYDTGAAPRYLCYADSISFSGSITQSTVNYTNSAPPYKSVEIDIKSSSYTGDGTESYDGYTIYSNLIRYYPNSPRPNISITGNATLSSDNYHGPNARIVLYVQEYNGATLIATHSVISSYYSSNSPSMYTNGITFPFSGDGYQGTAFLRSTKITGSDGEGGDTVVYEWSSYLVNVRSTGISFSGNNLLTIKVKAYLQAQYTGLIGYGHTITITDSNADYL